MGSGEAGPLPPDYLTNSFKNSSGTGLTKGVENYSDLIPSSLGLGGRLCRQTTFPGLFRSQMAK